MKRLVFKTTLFLKRLNVLRRLMLLGGALLLLNVIFIPELKFNLEMKNPKKMTIEEIQSTPKDKLPLYMVLENAQLMKVGNEMSSAEVDSFTHGQSSFFKGTGMKLMNYGYNYVIQQRVKKGDTTLAGVLYPVYSKEQIQKTPNVTAAQLTSFVVVSDTRIRKQDLEGDKYFNDSTFTIKGKFRGTSIDGETLRLLQESGYNVSKEAIVLNKGDEMPMSLTSTIILVTLASLVSFLCLLTFLPTGFFHKIFDEEQEIIKIK
jgi:hypothetical protein